MHFANAVFQSGRYLLGVAPADVARDGEALSNQPLALGFTPINDLSTIQSPVSPVRRFFIVGKLIKSGPDQHSPSFSSSARTAEVRWAGLPAFLCLQAIPRTRHHRGVRKAVGTTCLSVNSTQIWPTGYNHHWHPVRVGAYQ